MPRTQFLADTSVFARLAKPAVAAAFTPLAAQGLVAICSGVAFELGYACRSPADYLQLTERLYAFDSVPTTEADFRRGLDIQRALADRSRHRAISLVDGLVAAVAEAHQLSLLHYDHDFELIAKLTGQPHRWVVDPGLAD